MRDVPHQLAEEFPAYAAALDALRRGDDRFRRLADEYDRVNRSIHRMETNIAPAAEHIERGLRKRRLALKDEITALLRTLPA